VSQLAMDALVDQIDKAWFEARAVKPSELVPCDGGCGRTVWVSKGKRPALCWYCKTGERP
jgi:hypothetical protein